MARVPGTGEARGTYARYLLQCMHGAAALRMLYAPPKKRVSALGLLETLVQASYFAVEAYYTPDAVNVVVVGLQRRERVPCAPLSYVCSALENLGDLRTHAFAEEHSRHREEGRTSPKQAQGLVSADSRHLLLKYSKYVHRILHSLEGFRAAAPTLPRAEWYEANVLQHRASGRVDLVPWAAAGYRAGISVHAYIDDLTSQVLRAVEAFLQAQDLRFPA